jgi:hypothetical protein
LAASEPMASVWPSIVTVPPLALTSSPTAAIALRAAGDSSALANANSTSLGNRISTGLLPFWSGGPVTEHISGLTRGSLSCPPRSTGSSTKTAEPAGCTGTSTGSSPSTRTVRAVVSAGGAVNTAVTVTDSSGATTSPLLSLIRPELPSAVSTS